MFFLRDGDAYTTLTTSYIQCAQPLNPGDYQSLRRLYLIGQEMYGPHNQRAVRLRDEWILMVR